MFSECKAINTDIITELEKIILETIKYSDKKRISNENFYSEKELDENGDLIKNNPINNLDFDSLEKSTLITDATEKTLKRILGDPAHFKNPYLFLKGQKKKYF